MAKIIEPKVPFRQELKVLRRAATMEQVVTKKKTEIYAEFAKRLVELCNDEKIPERSRNKEVGRLAGTGYKGAEKWFKAMGMPSVAHGVNLAIGFKCSFEWLMTGRGPKRIGEQPTPHQRPSAAEGNEIRQIAAAWPHLLENTKKIILAAALEATTPTTERPKGLPAQTKARKETH